MRRLILLTTLALLAVAATGPPALGSGLDVIRDCTDDEVMSKTYTQKEYRDALRELAGDSDQYGNCRSVIQRAQAAAAAGKKKSGGGDAGTGPAGSSTGGGPSGGAGAIGSAPAAEQLQQATAAERDAVEGARKAAPGAVSLDDAAVDTAKVGTAPGLSQSADLPTPLAIMLALLLAGALAVVGLRVRRLVNARRA
ncbi:MAG TPA: hypothetical protein VGV90_15680 [Solirubrobacteraceae bacterium]|nr:hypothetical protein [Solirubrobacteraceae bacterium]